MSPELKAFFDGATNTVSYVARDPRGTACAIVGSVLNFDHASGRTDTKSADAIIGYIQSENQQLQWVMETHVHADYLFAAPYLQEKLGGKIGIGDQITAVQNSLG